ncbi:MAG: PilZ domain-containing protein [Candidatus Acidiferrales bacterium]
MTETAPSSRTASDKRRTTRVMKAVPITVKGSDALGQPIKEATATVMVNCNGCKFQSRHYIPKGQIITIEIRPMHRNQKPRIIRGRVIWVQRPRTVREVFHIGMEFDVPGNVWNIDCPPGDWFPHPEDEELVIPVYPNAGEPELVTAPSSAHHAEKSEAAASMRSSSRAIHAEPAESAKPSDGGKILPMRGTAQQHESQLALSRDLLKAAAQDAFAEELTRMRPQFDAQFQKAIEATIHSLVERVAEAAANDIVKQVTERTAATLEEARQACQAAAAQLDEKVHQAVEEALAAEDANPYKTPARRKRRPRF